MKYFRTENKKENTYFVGYRKLGTCVYVAEIRPVGSIAIEIELSADNMSSLAASVDNYFKYNF